MKHFLLYFFNTLVCTTILAQGQKETPLISDRNSNNQLLQYNMDMPMGVNAEQFVHGLVDFPITKDLALRMERSYFKFGDQEQVNAGFALKNFISKKFYLITGAEIQYDIIEIMGAPKRELPRLNLGMGSNLKPNLMIELGYKPIIGSNSAVLENNVISNRKSTFFFIARF